MNWKTIVLVSTVACTSLGLSSAKAQARGGHAAGSVSRMQMSSGRSSAPAHFAGRSGNANGSRWSGNGGHWNNGGNHDWNHNHGNWNHNGGHWHHRGHYPYYAYGFGYPFYYGFGYPYGYGYGYPYYGYGGVSAEYYYGGQPGYAGGGSRSLVAQVQQRLARGGYYRGSIDGVIGDGTRRAIRAYERSHGLPVDGRIDDDLLARMGLA